MFEFGFALLGVIFIAALMIVFRRLRSLNSRLDRLVADHDILANRALLFTLNRVHAEPIVPSSPEQSADARLEAQLARTDIHRLPSRVSVRAK